MGPTVHDFDAKRVNTNADSLANLANDFVSYSRIPSVRRITDKRQFGVYIHVCAKNVGTRWVGRLRRDQTSCSLKGRDSYVILNACMVDY